MSELEYEETTQLFKLIKKQYKNSLYLVNRGKLIQSFGFTKEHDRYLYPEEALYLLEIGAAKIISSEKEIISIKRLYNIIDETITLPVYTVYRDIRQSNIFAFRNTNNIHIEGYSNQIYDLYKPNSSFSLSSSTPFSHLVILPFHSKYNGDELLKYFKHLIISIIDGTSIMYYELSNEILLPKTSLNR